MWRAALECVRGSLIEGRDVKLLNVGTLYSATARERRLRHPVTQELIEVPAQTRVRFKVSPNLMESLSDV